MTHTHAKNRGQKSDGPKNRMETVDGRTRPIALSIPLTWPVTTDTGRKVNRVYLWWRRQGQVCQPQEPRWRRTWPDWLWRGPGRLHALSPWMDQSPWNRTDYLTITRRNSHVYRLIQLERCAIISTCRPTPLAHPLTRVSVSMPWTISLPTLVLSSCR